MKIKSKKYKPLEIAKWFVNRVDRESGDDMTPLKLQKLMYYAQSWWLANYNESLFEEDMQAWTHGPVVPSVYQEYKSNGYSPIDKIENYSFPYNEIEDYLDKVYTTYARHSAKRLEKQTHEEDPWRNTRGELPIEARCEDAIDKIEIRDYYSKRLKK